MESIRILRSGGRGANACTQQDTNYLPYTDTNTYPNPHTATEQNPNPGTSNTHPVYSPDCHSDAQPLPHPDTHGYHAQYHTAVDAHSHIHTIALIKRHSGGTSYLYRNSAPLVEHLGDLTGD